MKACPERSERNPYGLQEYERLVSQQRSEEFVLNAINGIPESMLEKGHRDSSEDLRPVLSAAEGMTIAETNFAEHQVAGIEEFIR